MLSEFCPMWTNWVSCGFFNTRPRAVVLSLKEFAKLCELIEDRVDEQDAAELSRQDRGIGIALKTIAKTPINGTIQNIFYEEV